VYRISIDSKGVVTLTPAQAEELGAWPVEGLGATLDRIRKGSAAGGATVPRVSDPPASETEDTLDVKLLDLASGKLV